MSYQSIIMADNPVGYWPLDELPGSLSQEILRDSPISYWPLNETSGTTASDISGNSRDIILNVGETRNVVGFGGLTATTFPGSDDGGVSTDAAFSGTGDCSISVWLKWTSGGTLYTPIAWRDDGVNGERLLVLLNHNGSSVVAGYVAFYRNGTFVTTYNGSYNDGKWRHFLFTVASNICTIYVNGIQVAQNTGATPAITAAGIRLGTNGVITPNSSQRFNGSMAQVAAFNTTLSSDRALAHYRAGSVTAYNYGFTVLNGTYTNSPVLGAIPFPAGGRAPYFDRSLQQYITIPDDNAWSPQAGSSGLMTLECWFYQTSYIASTYQMLVTKGSGTNGYEYALFCRGTDSLFMSEVSHHDGIPTADATMTISGLNRWHHVATTIDGNSGTPKVSLWIDGRYITAVTNGAITTTHGTAPLIFGNNADFGSNYFDGAIAHVALYDKLLSHNRIQARYLAGLGRARRHTI